MLGGKYTVLTKRYFPPKTLSKTSKFQKSYTETRRIMKLDMVGQGNVSNLEKKK